jgi:Domain of unknown function (DUF6894)
MRAPARVSSQHPIILYALMQRFYFSVVYGGVTHPDDRGDLFSTAAHAEAHAVQIANELGRKAGITLMQSQ